MLICLPGPTANLRNKSSKLASKPCDSGADVLLGEGNTAIMHYSLCSLLIQEQDIKNASSLLLHLSTMT